MRYLPVMVIALSCFGPGQLMANPTSNQPPTIPNLPPLNRFLHPAQEMFARGQRAYDAGDYAGAVSAWQDAYKLGDEHAVLYDIARAYRALGQYENARRVLRRYRKLATTRSEREQASHELARMDTCEVDGATVEGVSIQVLEPVFVSGEARNRIEIRNPTSYELTVTEIRTPELKKQGIDPRYVGGRAVPPFSALYGYVLFPAQHSLTLDSITITAVLESVIQKPLLVHATINPIIWVVPDKRVEHITVSVRGAYGAFWMDDAVPITENTGVADMRGVTVGVQKGMSELFVLEGDVTYAETGHATFEDMEIDGVTGDLSRRARLVRLLGSGALRTGKENIMSARLSFGLQLANYDSSLSTPTGTVQGPGHGAEFDVLVGGGISYMRRLGDHWSLGVSGSFGASMTSEAKAIEAGMHVGYGWNP